MSALVSFMNGPIGRLVRVALGVAIIVLAFYALDGAARWLVAAFGLVPIVLGARARCLVDLLPGARAR